MSQFSTILFASPSFAEGFARAFDIGDTMTEFNSSPTERQADATAIAADWRAVGEEMAKAICEYAKDSDHAQTRTE